MTFQLALAVCVLCVTWPKVSSRKCENTKMRSNCCKHNGPIELALSSICIPCKQRDNIGSALQLDVKAISQLVTPPTILYITYLDLSQTVWSGLAISTANEFAFSTVSLWKIVTIDTHYLYICYQNMWYISLSPNLSPSLFLSQLSAPARAVCATFPKTLCGASVPPRTKLRELGMKMVKANRSGTFWRISIPIKLSIKAMAISHRTVIIR